jgi:hypothetical protein
MLSSYTNNYPISTLSLSTKESTYGMEKVLSIYERIKQEKPLRLGSQGRLLSGGDIQTERSLEAWGESIA